MSKYVIMPKSDYKNACDSIRKATGKTDLITCADMVSELTTIINKIGKAEFKTTTMPSMGLWEDITYGGGKFVAIKYNSNEAAYSTDGITWTKSTLPVSGAWESIIYGNGKFVAIAEDGDLVYSTDGINWVNSTSLKNTSYWYHSVTYGNGKFVTVTYPKNTYNSVINYSTDGINWSTVILNKCINFYFVTYGNGKFVATQNSKTPYFYSSDGINWTESTLPTGVSYFAYGNGKFIGKTSSGYNVIYSTDGINWTNYSTTLTNSFPTKITEYNNKFIILYETGCMYSTDGINWSEYTLPSASEIGLTRRNLKSIVYGDNKLVIIQRTTQSSVAFYCDLNVKIA